MKNFKFLTTAIAILFSVAIFTSCEEEVDPCEAVTCLNDGICMDGTCDCPEGYSGTTCETHCSSSVVGTYTAAAGNNCYATTFVISSGASDNQVNVTFNNADFGAIPLTGTLSSDCSSITLDASGSTGTGFQGIEAGSITISGNTITVTLDPNAAGGNCTATASM